jgi:hypothetical protein
MPVSPRSVLFALVAAGFGAIAPAHADTGIGKAADVATQVSASLAGASAIPLLKGDLVYQNQVVSTDANGVGQIEFVDGTKLAIGPGSSMTLDTFVFNPDKTANKVVIELGKGSFRFITGKSPHDAYDISTPTATLGLRGTAFDVTVGDDGDMAVAMLNGEINACSKTNGACQIHNLIGKFLYITPDGIFSIHDTWDGTFMRGVKFTEALPFMADQKILRPAFKTTTRVANLYLKTAANAAEKVGDTADKAVKAPANAVKPMGDFLKKLNPFKN